MPRTYCPCCDRYHDEPCPLEQHRQRVLARQPAPIVVIWDPDGWAAKLWSEAPDA